MPKTILVVANRDYRATLEACEGVLTPKYALMALTDPVSALDTIKGPASVDLLVADYILSMGMFGENLIEEAHTYRPEMPAILVASLGQSSDVLRPALDKIKERISTTGMARVDYLTKPIDKEALKKMVAEMIGE